MYLTNSDVAENNEKSELRDMSAMISFFPVGNGDMTLIELESGRTILIDVNIREAADNPDDSTPNVAAKLRKRLKQDDQGRHYVDVFIQSHPDLPVLRPRQDGNYSLEDSSGSSDE